MSYVKVQVPGGTHPNPQAKCRDSCHNVVTQGVHIDGLQVGVDDMLRVFDMYDEDN